MRTIILSSFVTILSAVAVNAQDLEQVKKTIDAEKFSEARKSLKSMVETTPDKGKNYSRLYYEGNFINYLLSKIKRR